MIPHHEDENEDEADSESEDVANKPATATVQYAAVTNC
jgi:hypothetical protein